MLRQGLPQPSRCYSPKNGLFIDHDGLEFCLPLGASRLPGNDWRFSVWAPAARALSIHLVGSSHRVVPMKCQDSGYFSADIEMWNQVRAIFTASRMAASDPIRRRDFSRREYMAPQSC